ncbi:hypothetical protein HaLaN_27352 [Haematococcus lacustris]|uniref:Uncharacterized protein n=1 Tax=Haematococcus lacustris TaxID=44745 RepID=A0A6A0A8L5_HAELA|nr:hypothetical protein HaLaN_27352 [Haematococcus lacustris]
MVNEAGIVKRYTAELFCYPITAAGNALAPAAAPNASSGIQSSRLPSSRASNNGVAKRASVARLA